MGRECRSLPHPPPSPYARLHAHGQSVSTDPSNFTIQLITPSSPNDPITIAENVKSSDKSYIYTPASDLTAADQYRVNFVSAQAGILAQSGFFAVEQGTS